MITEKTLDFVRNAKECVADKLSQKEIHLKEQEPSFSVTFTCYISCFDMCCSNSYGYTSAIIKCNCSCNIWSRFQFNVSRHFVSAPLLVFAFHQNSDALTHYSNEWNTHTKAHPHTPSANRLPFTLSIPPLLILRQAIAYIFESVSPRSNKTQWRQNC